MIITFSKNPIDRFLVWCDNTYEKFTHRYWNKSPHHVRCRICGEVITSEKPDSPSPEERGWRCTKDGYTWICHRCDCHRFYEPYVELADLDELIANAEEKDKWFYKSMKRVKLKKMIKEAEEREKED